MKIHSLFSSVKGRTQYKRREKGFSLLEILIVMGILGVLMSLGYAEIINYRHARQIDTLAYAVREMVKDARGKSMAASTQQTDIGSSSWPVAYAVVLDAVSVKTHVLYGANTEYSPWSDWTEGSGSIGDLYETEHGVVQVTFNDCDRVLFESVNGTMHIYDGTFSAEVDSCTIYFELAGYSRQLILNASEKRFEIQ